MQTRARPDGDTFVLNGQKMWTTNGAEAGVYLLFANADPDKGYKGVTAFMVERDMPGFWRWEKRGQAWHPRQLDL